MPCLPLARLRVRRGRSTSAVDLSRGRACREPIDLVTILITLSLMVAHRAVDRWKRVQVTLLSTYASVRRG